MTFSRRATYSQRDALKQPAVSRYGATTPALLKWFETFNSGREYTEQVKPFNFLNAFHARPQIELPDAEQWAKPKRGRPRKQSDMKPVSAFNKNIREGAKAAFDRETGKPVPASLLMTYAEALAQYHLRPEAKFLNGDFCDRGRTERRHVIATQIVHIGKEANKWEEQHFLGEDEDAEIEYGAADGAESLDAKIRDLRKNRGARGRDATWGFADGVAASAETRGRRDVEVDACAACSDGAVCDPRGMRRPKRRRSLLLVIHEHEAPTRSKRLAIRPEPEDC
jgi:hypothetical protein